MEIFRFEPFEDQVIYEVAERPKVVSAVKKRRHPLIVVENPNTPYSIEVKVREIISTFDINGKVSHCDFTDPPVALEPTLKQVLLGKAQDLYHHPLINAICLIIPKL